MTGEITAQTLTIKKGQGLTYALLDLVKAQKMEISDGKITLAEWNAAIDKLAEIQQARRQAGKASIFTGGTDKNDYQTNFVVHPNQQIEFSAEEMNMLYTAMGVSLASGTADGTQNQPTEQNQPAEPEESAAEAQNKRVTEPWHDDGERITEYDASGKEIKEIYKDGSGKITNTLEYEYDTSGNEIKAIRKDGSGNVEDTYEYEYNASGNQIKYIHKDGSGNITNTLEYEYDASGNEIKRIYKDGSGNIDCTYDYEYDSSGNEIKEIYKDGSGKIAKTWDYEYDASGHKIKTISCPYNADGKIRDIYEYEYDTSGNQIKYIHKDSSGKIIE
jgi:hypothetical protein